ncbi:MAG: hypothetical protein CMJ42_15460 [Phyllobacteriaceae bacterium]|nr:hypothetical protein [Phyllobacteriaceae bacterium]MBA91401.1 hypothetical protein [Phyllobacteriaceae bacterium]
MIWRIDPFWLVMGFIVVTMLSYLFGYALDRIMRSDGFGPAGNMVVLVAGFFGTIYLCNWYGIPFRNIQIAVAAGLGGGFALISLAAIAKGIFYRAD